MNRAKWIFVMVLLPTILSNAGKAPAAGEAFSREGSKPSEFKNTLEPNHADTLDEAPARDRKLVWEDLRSLLYLYSRLNQPAMVESVAQRILNNNPRDKETLELLASFYLERKNAARAIKYSRALVTFHPDDTEGRFLLAMAYNLDGRSGEAREILEKLKSEQFQNRSFPYEADLASIALSSGDWLQAIRSYREALDNPRLEAQQRREVGDQLDQLYRIHFPQLFLKETFSHFQSGLIFRTALSWSMPLTRNHRLHIDSARDDLKLNGTEELRPQWASRYDVLAGIESQYSRWRTKVFGGIGDEGAVYGGTVTRVMAEENDLTVGINGNQRATDSLLLETLGGRENELFVLWQARLFADIVANVKLRGRQVFVHGETLGEGYSVDMNMERTPFERIPELQVGYRGLITDFSRSSEDVGLVDDVAAPAADNAERLLLLKNLVSPINLHGIFFSWQQTLDPRWSWHAVVGSDYSFTRSSVGHTFEAGVSYFPSRSAELNFNAGYSTSASTSEQDSERIELGLAFRWHF